MWSSLTSGYRNGKLELVSWLIAKWTSSHVTHLLTVNS
jgi:hypothetical protein